MADIPLGTNEITIIVDDNNVGVMGAVVEMRDSFQNFDAISHIAIASNMPIKKDIICNCIFIES